MWNQEGVSWLTWLDRTLGTGRWGAKLKTAGAQALFFFSGINHLGWDADSAEKNDYKFLPVCSSWRSQRKHSLLRLVTCPGQYPKAEMGHPEGKSVLLTPSNLTTVMWMWILKNSLHILFLQEGHSWPDSFKAASTSQAFCMKPPNQTRLYSQEAARKDFYAPRLPEHGLQVRSKVALWVGIANMRLASSALFRDCSSSNEKPHIKTNTHIKTKDPKK